MKNISRPSGALLLSVWALFSAFGALQAQPISKAKGSGKAASKAAAGKATNGKAAAETAAAPKAETITLPPGAVQVNELSWQYIDKQGKKWIYMKTPFGMMRQLDQPVAQAATPAADPADLIQVKQEGSTLHFSRPTPFGNHSWSKPAASALTTEEQRAFDRIRSATPAADAAAAAAKATQQ